MSFTVERRKDSSSRGDGSKPQTNNKASVCLTFMALNEERNPQFLEVTDTGESSPSQESNLKPPFFFSCPPLWHPLTNLEPCSINREEIEVGVACEKPHGAPTRVNSGVGSQTPPASLPRQRQNRIDMTSWVVRDKG